jgi:hypothetical protein
MDRAFLSILVIPTHAARRALGSDLGGDNQDENRIASPELLPNHDSCLA